jgi:hypothetical protein
VLIRALDTNRVPVQTWTTAWRLTSLLPAATNTAWCHTQFDPGLPAGTYTFLLGVQNPLSNGVPFRFANETQDADVAGWLTLGQVTVLANPQRPFLRGRWSAAGFDLLVSNAATGVWTVECTSDFTQWTQFTTTNSVTSEWMVTDESPSPAARFYRVFGPPGAPAKSNRGTMQNR